MNDWLPLFLRPGWLLALVPVALVIGSLRRRRHRHGHWQALLPPALQPWLLSDSDRQRSPLGLVLLGLAWQLRAVGMTRLAGLLLVALAAQICLGLSNVAFGLPLAVAVGHNAGGAALLLSLVLVNYHARTSLVRVRNQLPFGWRFIPRKHVSGLITLKGEMPWRP